MYSHRQSQRDKFYDVGAPLPALVFDEEGLWLAETIGEFLLGQSNSDARRAERPEERILVA